MTAPKTISLEAVKALAKKSFHALGPSRTQKGKCTVAVEVGSYVELHLLLLNIIKLSVAALDADSQGVTNVEGTPFAVRSVLEVAAQLVPIDEMYLLDELHAMLMDDGD